MVSRYLIEPQGCRNNPCKFGGTCILASDGSETCKCKDGFSGTFCDIGLQNKDIKIFIDNFLNFGNNSQDINECLSSPCQNGGTCIDLENSYACYCPDGYFRPTFCPASLPSALTSTPIIPMSLTTPTTSKFYVDIYHIEKIVFFLIYLVI